MTRVYTNEWNGFQFRAPNYLDGRRRPYEFDLVKYHDHEPVEVTDLYSGKKVMRTRSCFSIGFLTWDPDEGSFEFKSCGLRYLEHRIDGLENFILDFCEMMQKELMREEE